MVGLCGSCGLERLDIEPLTAGVSRRRGDNRFEYGSGTLRGMGATHHPSGQPVVVGESTSLVVWGTVYSREQGGRYERRPEGVSTAEFCGRAYESDGIDALTEMNGEFVCIIEDRGGERVRIMTDRLGSQPVYYHATYGAITFSTAIQSLAVHPEIETEYEPEYLAEYLGTKTVRGLKTPFVGIAQLPPASIVTLDPEAGVIEASRYWQPVYRPENRPFSTFINQFVDRFLAPMDDRIRDGKRYGLLLSGGSDSRLVLSAFDPEKSYSFGDPADEIETAQRVAQVAGVPFVHFRSDSAYSQRLLERNGEVGSFIGWFNEGRAIGVESVLAEEVDALVSGLYADVLFKGWTIPTRRRSVFGQSLPISTQRRIETRDDVLGARANRTPPYLPDGVCRRVHDRNLSDRAEIPDHGVQYPSYASLSRHGFWYPLTNETSFDRYSDQQTLPTVYPFLDRRLIELSLSIPTKYALRYTLVDRALSRIAPELASIPHEDSGVALSRPRWLHRLGIVHRELRSAQSGNAADLREMTWIKERLIDHESTIRALPAIEYETVLETYHDHMNGADHTAALCGLLTLLEMPATTHLTANEPVSTVR